MHEYGHATSDPVSNRTRAVLAMIGTKVGPFPGRSGYHSIIRFVLLRGKEPEKGTVPICRNGPEGASHKWGLSPFPAPAVAVAGAASRRSRANAAGNRSSCPPTTGRAHAPASARGRSPSSTARSPRPISSRPGGDRSRPWSSSRRLFWPKPRLTNRNLRRRECPPGGKSARSSRRFCYESLGTPLVVRSLSAPACAAIGRTVSVRSPFSSRTRLDRWEFIHRCVSSASTCRL